MPFLFWPELNDTRHWPHSPWTNVHLIVGCFQGQGVIKPIACRPVVSSANSTPILGARTPLTAHRAGLPAPPPQAQLQQQQQQLNRAAPWGLHNSTCDLRTNPVKGSTLQHRFSWAKSEDCNTDRRLQHRQLELRNEISATGASNRVADLSRRFGGSLCSVALPPASKSPSSLCGKQPPAYRPPPSRAPGNPSVWQ